jgi:membrane protease YdiL (CAAX protease family)
MGHGRTVVALCAVLGLLVAGVLAALVHGADASATSTFRWPVFALVATAWALLAFFLARCYENLHRLRVAGWRLKPGTVVVGMLLPLVNLLVLRLAVSELWKTSHPWEGGGGLDSWRKQTAGAVPILWWIMAVALWIAGGAVAARVLGGEDPAASILLFSLVAVFWSIATYALVSRLAARQVQRRSRILSTYRTEAGMGVVRPVYARPAAELELNHAFGVLGFTLLALRAIQLLFGFLGLDHPLFALVSAQVAFLFAGIAIAGLQGVSLGQLLEDGPVRPLTLPVAMAMARSLGLPTENGEAEGEILLAFLVVSVLVAPFVEEVIFRGILYEGFDRALRPRATVFVTSAVFGLAHVHVVQSPVTFFLGLACGYARWKTGSLAAPIAIHLGNNLAVSAMALSGMEPSSVLWIALGGAVVAPGLRVLSGRALPLEPVARKAAGVRDRLKGGTWRLPDRMKAGRDLLRSVYERLPVWIAALRRLEWGSIIVTLGLGIAALRSAAAGVAFLKIAPLGMGRFLAACYYGFVAAALARGQRARAVVLLLPLAWFSVQGAFSAPQVWGMRATAPDSDTGWRILSLAMVLAGILVATGFRPWARVLQWRRSVGASADRPPPSVAEPSTIEATHD